MDVIQSWIPELGKLGKKINGLSVVKVELKYMKCCQATFLFCMFLDKDRWIAFNALTVMVEIRKVITLSLESSQVSEVESRLKSQVREK